MSKSLQYFSTLGLSFQCHLLPAHFSFSSLQAPCGGGKAGQQISSPQDVGQLIHAKSLGKHGDEAQQPRLSLPQNAKAGNMVPRLVETDPFSKNDVIRCKAC